MKYLYCYIIKKIYSTQIRTWKIIYQANKNLSTMRRKNALRKGIYTPYVN